MSAWPVLAVGFQPQATIVSGVSAHRLRDYASASGDANPIHVDEATARRAGFGGPIVHGTLIAALVEEAVARAMTGHEIVSQAIQFLAPVEASIALVVSARVVKVFAVESEDHAILRVMVKNAEDRPMAMAEVEIVRRAVA